MNKCFCGKEIKPYYPNQCNECREKGLKIVDSMAMETMIKKWGIEWFRSRANWSIKQAKIKK